MAHREDIREFLEALEFDSHTIIDWGSGSKPVERYVKHNNCNFIRVDQNVNPAYPPHYKVDIQKALLIKQADFAFCIEVLEHTLDPLSVLINIYKNLKPGGTLYLSVPFLYPEHGENDYLRFTRHALKAYTEQAGFKEAFINEITDGFVMEARK